MEKNIIFFTSALFLITILSLGISSAYSFFDYSESWFYSEDITGEDRSFSITYETIMPQSTTFNNEPYDWSYEGYNHRRLNQENIYLYYNAKDRYDANQALQSAFRTFSRNSQQQLKNEQQREQNRNHYRSYSSFGYYPRYYSWW